MASMSLLIKLLSVQNATARLVAGTAKFGHITLVPLTASSTMNCVQGGASCLQVTVWSSVTLPSWLLSACLNCLRQITHSVNHFRCAHRKTSINCTCHRGLAVNYPLSGTIFVSTKLSSAEFFRSFNNYFHPRRNWNFVRRCTLQTATLHLGYEQKWNYLHRFQCSLLG
jgi:hypothetical protein